MKNSFLGMGKVFKFSYVQSVKSKAFIISLAILCAIALISMPLISLLSGVEANEEEYSDGYVELIGTVYIEDNAFDGELAKSIINNLTTVGEYTDKDYKMITSDKHEEILDEVRKSEAGTILVEIKNIDNIDSTDYGFNYITYYGEELENLSDAADVLSSYIDSIHRKSLADMLTDNEDVASKEILDYSYDYHGIELEQGEDDSFANVDEFGNIIEDKRNLDEVEYWVTYALLMVAVFSMSLLGGKVAEQIVTEKSSKVIEYIMTSIRPMALITGKVIASVALIFTMMGAIVASLLGSVLINGVLFKSKDGTIAIPEVVKSVFNGDVFQGASPVSIIIGIVLFGLGFVFYGYIAGIAGATVSKIEEMAEGVKIFTFAMIIGAYLALFYIISANGGAADWGVVTNIIYLFPLSSVFIVPAYLILGKISLAMGIISLAIMLACTFLLMIFVSGIFEYLIYYNGSPMKIKQLIGLFRSKRRMK